MTHRRPFQPLLFCDSVILPWLCAVLSLSQGAVQPSLLVSSARQCLSNLTTLRVGFSTVPGEGRHAPAVVEQPSCIPVPAAA